MQVRFTFSPLKTVVHGGWREITDLGAAAEEKRNETGVGGTCNPHHSKKYTVWLKWEHLALENPQKNQGGLRLPRLLFSSCAHLTQGCAAAPRSTEVGCTFQRASPAALTHQGRSVMGAHSPFTSSSRPGPKQISPGLPPTWLLMSQTCLEGT